MDPWDSYCLSLCFLKHVLTYNPSFYPKQDHFAKLSPSWRWFWQQANSSSKAKSLCRLFRGYGRKSLLTDFLQGLTLQTIPCGTLSIVQLDRAGMRIIILPTLIEFSPQYGLLGSGRLPLLSKVPRAVDIWTHSWLKIHSLEWAGWMPGCGLRVFWLQWTLWEPRGSQGCLGVRN